MTSSDLPDAEVRFAGGASGLVENVSGIPQRVGSLDFRSDRNEEAVRSGSLLG